MIVMRKAAVVIAVSSAVTAGAVALGIVSSPAQADDDISNYDGTTCPNNQFYDATDGTCATDAVTNDPQGVLTQEQQGVSDPGNPCKESQFYDVDQQQCAPAVVTNFPDATVAPQGEDPTNYAVPSATGIPNCANDSSDPFWICT